MNAVALVDAVLRDERLCKKIGKQLDRIEPSDKAVQRAIAAFHRGSCEPWLTAYLLGCIGHRVGYETTKAILLSNAGMSSEAYAADAMAKILGIEAYEDLREILFGDHSRKILQGAVSGMARVSPPQLLDDLITAFSERRLLLSTVSYLAAKCNPTEGWLVSLAHRNDARLSKLSRSIAKHMSLPHHAQPGFQDQDGFG